MSQQMKYTVDIVLCIDATGSMAPVIDHVKENAIKFHQDLTDNLTIKGKGIDVLRVKVIKFRDYFADGKNAMELSPFYSLPVQKTNFSMFVSTIVADGGGDDPESSLEALALAMKSEWNKGEGKHRRVIVLYTDAPAHKLEKGAGSYLPNYPSDLPKNLDELTDLWDDQEFSAKRLIIYGPEDYPWKEIATWDNTIIYTSRAGEGLEEHDYSAIIDAIANSI